MKKIILILQLTLFTCSNAFSNEISFSPHDLSLSSFAQKNNLKFKIKRKKIENFEGVCIMCHTPHKNRKKMIFIDKDFPKLMFKENTNKILQKNSLLVDTVNLSSKRCLECHDGSIASNVKVNIGNGHKYSILYAGEIGSKSEADNKIGNFYSIKNLNCDKNNCTTGPEGSKIYLHNPGNGMLYVECVSCHEPHGAYSNKNFLRITANQSRLCFACHIK